MKENEYLLLLFKRFSADITPAEADQLENWLQASPEHRRLADQYAKIWETSAGYQKTFQPDLEADFARVQSKIRQAEPQLRPALSFRRNLLRAAAAITLLIAAFLGYQNWNTNNADYFNATAAVMQQDKEMLQLSDGTKVWLRKGSRLNYPANFADKKLRRVQLHGEAFFQVSHDAAHPFQVELPSGAKVEVLGTEFNVCQDAEKESVFVRSGKVRFSADSKSQTPVLTANQKAVFDIKAKKLSYSSLQNSNELAWQNNRLEFVRTPLHQVVKDLETYFHVKIDLKNPDMANCTHSAVHQNPVLGDILDALAVTYQFQVTQAGPEAYILGGGKCR